jgi:hypothetical protein
VYPKRLSLLFGFPMRVVLTAMRAEFLHFETLSGRLLVFGARVVPVLAFLALERDDFSWHFCLPLYVNSPGARLVSAGTNPKSR